jgi:hypothetical protein
MMEDIEVTPGAAGRIVVRWRTPLGWSSAFAGPVDDLHIVFPDPDMAGFDDFVPAWVGEALARSGYAVIK